MANHMTGWNDTYRAARLAQLTGTTYPAALGTPYLGFFLSEMPASDGSGNTDSLTRQAVAWTAPAQDASGAWYIQPTAGVVVTAPTAGLVAGASYPLAGFGIFAAASGGLPVYVAPIGGAFVRPGVTWTMPPEQLRIWAESV